MVIDLLCSVLSGMPFGPHINKMYGEMEEPRRLGHFICVWDVRRIMPLERFVERMGEVAEEFHALPPAAGFDRVYYPGELEGLRREERRRLGVPLDPGCAMSSPSWESVSGSAFPPKERSLNDAT